MNELIQNTKQWISSKEIAQITDKIHKNVIRDIKSLIEQGAINGLSFEPVKYIDEKGELRPMYNLDKEASLVLATGYNAPLRAKIIRRWMQLEAMQSFDIPKNYHEALYLSAKTEEARLKLEIENKRLKPKAAFYDQVTGSKDAIDIGQAAKALHMGIGRNHLFEILRGKDVLMNSNIPYQKYVDCGYFRVIEQKYITPDGTTHINLKPVVYQKGLDFIRKLLSAKTEAGLIYEN